MTSEIAMKSLQSTGLVVEPTYQWVRTVESFRFGTLKPKKWCVNSRVIKDELELFHGAPIFLAQGRRIDPFITTICASDKIP